MTDINDSARPSYLRGNLAPVEDEIEAFDLPVEGTLPPELSGRYFRNGPNPQPGEDPGHWFGGAGMLHGVRITGGKARWYRNRWVKTDKLAGNPYLRPDGSVDRKAVNANTHVIRHAGRTMALVENGLPYLVDDELGTIGPCDFDGALATSMTAHPKLDPSTGDLHFFGYAFKPPFVTYHRLSADGVLVESRPIDVPGPIMMHDFAITRSHVIWLDLPMVFRKRQSMLSIDFDAGHGARIGVMPHGGEVTWFDIDPCYVFHVGNASTDAAGRVVVDACRYSPADIEEVWQHASGSTVDEQADDSVAALGARMHRWILDPANGRVTEQPIDDRPVEFPTIDNALTGVAARYVYTVDHDSVVKYDTQTGSHAAHRIGADRIPGEAVFVPAADGTAEDDGWLLSIDGDPAGTASRLVVLDAKDMTSAPVATIRLPRRVPAGFHGSWLAD